MTDPFDVYSWKTWFESLDFQQLQQLRNKWLKILPLTKGFEYLVLNWDINQVTCEIVKRLEETHTSDVAPTNQDSQVP